MSLAKNLYAQSGDWEEWEDTVTVYNDGADTIIFIEDSSEIMMRQAGIRNYYSDPTIEGSYILPMPYTVYGVDA